MVALIKYIFFLQGRARREASITELIRYLKGVWVPRGRKWLILFPEGGFLRKRKETSNRYCRRLGLPELDHVTLPRLGALQAIIDTIGPSVIQSHKPNYPPRKK